MFKRHIYKTLLQYYIFYNLYYEKKKSMRKEGHLELTEVKVMEIRLLIFKLGHTTLYKKISCVDLIGGS